MSDLDAVASVEAECFPPAEAATKEEFAERLRYYGDYFWLMFEDEKLIAFVDGFVTDEKDLTDEMYEKASMHNENGAWQMIFGVNTLPAYRKQGYAGELIREAIRTAKNQGRKGLVLTCKDALVPYYAKFGFQNEGVSGSVHRVVHNVSVISGVVAAYPSNHLHASVDGAHRHADKLVMLVRRMRRVFAGRAADHDSRGAVLILELKVLFKSLIVHAVLVEGRNYCGA